MRYLTTMRRQLSADSCNRIFDVHQAGSSQKDIAQVFRITQWSISNDPETSSRDWSNDPLAKIWLSQENHS